MPLNNSDPNDAYTDSVLKYNRSTRSASLGRFPSRGPLTGGFGCMPSTPPAARSFQHRNTIPTIMEESEPSSLTPSRLPSGKKRKSRKKKKKEDDLPLEMLEFPLPEHLWVDDKRANQCHSCTNKFSVFSFSGKHHCRICGNVVCAICSVSRFRGHRICRKCKTDAKTLRRFPDLADGSVQNPSVIDWDLSSESGGEETTRHPMAPSNLPTKGNETAKPTLMRPHTIAGQSNFQVMNSQEEQDQLFLTENALLQAPVTPTNIRTLDNISSETDFGSGKKSNNGRPQQDVMSVSSMGDQQANADLSTWKTPHVLYWLKREGVDSKDTADVIKELCLNGVDLLELSDDDLKNELKIKSAIIRRRVLRALRRLKKEDIDALVNEVDDIGGEKFDSAELNKLAKEVAMLKRGMVSPVDRITLFNSPNLASHHVTWSWKTTHIPPGVHIVTVVDCTAIKNTSKWVLKVDNNNSPVEAHCLTQNPSSIRWRSTSKGVEICANNNAESLSTELCILINTLQRPDEEKVDISITGPPGIGGGSDSTSFDNNPAFSAARAAI